MRIGWVLSVGCLLSSCLANGPLIWVRNKAPEPAAKVERLKAGVAEVDLTPPPGLPTYGFSSAGAAHAEGYWLRLRGRIIVLQSGTTKLAMLQLDLGAASPLLHRKVAQRTERFGLFAPQLVMATTHTHGGPSAIYGDKVFNSVVGALAKFDEHLVDAMADSIAKGVEAALGNMKDARAAWGQAQVPGPASSNRSRDAWLANFEDGRVPGADVDRTLTLLRIDAEENGKTTPLAAWSIFAVHGNSIGAVRADEPKASLFHGDIHGLSARLTAHKIERRSKVSGFLAATTTGAEGDVTPGPRPGGPQGLPLTMSVAELVSEAADELHHSLDDAIARPEASTVPIAVVYDETSLRGANTSRGRLCPSAFLGGPQLRGSEEGRGVPGWLAPILRTDEGIVDPPHGCTATKVYALGPLGVQEIAVMPEDFPDVGTFQLITFGESATGLALAAVPGEPTTEVGRMVMSAIADERWKGTIAVMGLTNAYLLYITTGAEYVVQDYEGGGTLFGGHEGTFVAEEFGRLAARWKPQQVTVNGFDLNRAFRPGAQTDLIPTGHPCEPPKWSPGALDVGPKHIVFHWTGAHEEEACALAKIRVECGGQVLFGEGGFVQNDEGFSFEVRRERGNEWSASWAVNGRSDQPCQFVVEAGATQVHSRSFSLTGRTP